MASGFRDRRRLSIVNRRAAVVVHYAIVFAQVFTTLSFARRSDARPAVYMKRNASYAMWPRSRSPPLKRQWVVNGTAGGRDQVAAGFVAHRSSQMKIKIMTIHVDDQEKARKFYSEVLGFTKKADFSNGGYRWLTVASPEEPNGPELQLEANTNPAARTYQQARFQQSQPAAIFYVDDVQSEYDRLKGLGVKFTMPPSKVTGATIAVLDDTCGNLIQITALDRWQG
jgi:predicted enzyme related to lactoylglutathione lyase